MITQINEALLFIQGFIGQYKEICLIIGLAAAVILVIMLSKGKTEKKSEVPAEAEVADLEKVPEEAAPEESIPEAPVPEAAEEDVTAEAAEAIKEAEASAVETEEVPIQVEKIDLIQDSEYLIGLEIAKIEKMYSELMDDMNSLEENLKPQEIVLEEPKIEIKEEPEEVIPAVIAADVPEVIPEAVPVVTVEPAVIPAEEVKEEPQKAVQPAQILDKDSYLGKQLEKIGMDACGNRDRLKSIEIKIEKAEIVFRYGDTDEKKKIIQEVEKSIAENEEKADLVPDNQHLSLKEETGEIRVQAHIPYKKFGADNFNTTHSGRVFSEMELDDLIKD